MGTTVGLPRMTAFPGERRDFLPALVRALERAGAEEILLERGYGEGVGVASDDYLDDSRTVRFADREECLGQPVVLVLRCPPDADLDLLQRGFLPGLDAPSRDPSRPHRSTPCPRRAWLEPRLRRRRCRAPPGAEHGTGGVGRRGRCLQGDGAPVSGLRAPGRPPLRVTVLGSGAVGTAAVHVATMYGDPTLRTRLHEQGVPGVEVVVVDYDLSGVETYMLKRLRMTDLLIDAAHRRDPAVPAVPNAWIGVMPEHATLLDLAGADPYDVEGSTTDPEGARRRAARLVGTVRVRANGPSVGPCGPTGGVGRIAGWRCRATPGPGSGLETAWEIQGEQLEDVMDVALSSAPGDWDPRSGHHAERAVARGEMERWLRAHTG